MARLVSNGDHNFTAASWLVADTNGITDSEASTVSITTSTTTHTSPTFTPGAITVDGILLKISSRAASPTGTFTVVLRNSTGAVDVTSVVVNVSDLKLAGWHYFKFSAPQLLLAATNYAVRLTCSVSGEVVMYRVSLQNFTKLIVTTTTAAPAANDQTIITKAYTGAGTSTGSTVTMDNTASTAFGGVAATYVDAMAVSGGGVLTWGTTAATNYLLTMKGLISIWDGSTWNMGTSGTRIPSNSTAKLAFSVSTNVDSGFVAKAGSTVNIYGTAKATNWTYLNTDEAAGQTVLGVVSTSGWNNGDEICIAGTSRTYTEAERRTISTVDSSTQITVSSGLTNSHSGTSPARAEVGNLTRNVSIFGTSATAQGYVRLDTSSTCNCDSVEFYWLGSASNGKDGVESNGATFSGCTFRDFIVTSSDVKANSGTFTDCVFYNILGFIDSLAPTLIRCLAIGGNSSMNSTLLSVGSNINILNSNFANAKTIGINSSASYTITQINGVTIHGCGSSGLGFPSGSVSGEITNSVFYRCGTAVSFNGSGEVTFDSCVFFGNTTKNIVLAYFEQPKIFKNCTFNGDSAFSTSYGIEIGCSVSIDTCSFGVASGILTANASADIQVHSHARVTCRNTIMTSASEVELIAAILYHDSGAVVSQKHDQTDGLNKFWAKYGVVSTDQATYRTSTPSLAMTPNSASNKLRATLPQRHFMVPVDSGQTVTFTCYVYKSAAYNGNQPRLLVLSNSCIGITNDTVLDTAIGGTGSWLELTGTTIAATAAGVMEFTVDCDGTAGVVYVSDISVS